MVKPGDIVLHGETLTLITKVSEYRKTHTAYRVNDNFDIQGIMIAKAEYVKGQLDLTAFNFVPRKIISKKDLILYSHWEYKTPQYFEFLSEVTEC